MNPTEYETTVAMAAAAQYVYDAERGQLVARTGEEVPTWDEADQAVRNVYLDAVTPTVWAALKAVPDRLAPIRQLMHEVNPKIHQDMVDFHHEVKVLLSGRPG